MIKMIRMKKFFLLLFTIGLVSEIFAQTFQEYKAKVEQGDTDAQFCLGVHYITATGVPADIIKGVVWLRKVATQGYSEAKEALEAL